MLVSNEEDLVFTSNRSEKTVGIFQHDHDQKLEKVKVGGFPNGLAFDPSSQQLLAANVAKPDDPTPITVSLVNAKQKILDADIVVPGRTRWAVFDEKSACFYVNIANPPSIVAVDARDPDGVESTFKIPATGPHGLDVDPERGRLYCACDQGGLFTVEIGSGKVSHSSHLAGSPDVIFFNQQLQHLYVAIGDPGLIEIFDTKDMKLVEKVKTEPGAHTIAFNPDNRRVYAFLPETHRASVWIDE